LDYELVRGRVFSLEQLLIELGGLFNPSYEEQQAATDRCVAISSITTLVFLLIGLLVPTIGGIIFGDNVLKEYGICDFYLKFTKFNYE